MAADIDVVTVDYPIAKAMRGVAFKVRFTGMKVWRARVWLACMTMHLAALIAGCAVEIEDRTVGADPAQSTI